MIIGIFYNKNSPSDRWEKIKKEQNIEIKPYEKMNITIVNIFYSYYKIL